MSTENNTSSLLKTYIKYAAMIVYAGIGFSEGLVHVREMKEFTYFNTTMWHVDIVVGFAFRFVFWPFIYLYEAIILAIVACSDFLVYLA